MYMKYFSGPFVIILLLNFIATSASAQTKVYNIINYGAVADGKTNNTNVIQSAIDDASADGGGR